MFETGKSMKAVYHNGVLELKKPLQLREGEEVMVIIQPVDVALENDKWDRFRAAAGAWGGIVDENIKEDLHSLRHLKTRSEIIPWQ